MSHPLLTLVVLALTGSIGPALAQGWVETAAPSYREAGIVAARIINDEANSTATLIRCVNGEVQLIVAGTGGDPPEGAATVSAGAVRVRTQFTPDSSLQRAIGVPASRAMVPADLIAEMAKARSLSVTTTMRFGNGQVSSQTRNTPLTGFSRLMSVLRPACMGGATQMAASPGSGAPAARVQGLQQPAPSRPTPADDDIDAMMDDLAGKPAPATPPRTPAQLPTAARKLLEGYAQSCRDMGGRDGGFRGKGVYIADLNSDGVLDYVYYLGDYTCPGGPPGAGFCGASGGCSVDIVMSGPQGHREVEGWIGVLDVAIGKAGNQEIIILTNKRPGGGTGVTRHRWSGRGFVRM